MQKGIALLLLAAVAGCAGFAPEYEDRLRRATPNPRDVEILSRSRYPGKVLCGEYVSWETNSPVRRTRRFAVGPDFVLSAPSTDEEAIICSSDSLAVLYERSGIGGPDIDWGQLQKVSDDLALLKEGIDTYYNRNRTLPRELSALIGTESGVAQDNLIDPWGNPYRYKGGLAGRSMPNPKLSTYGADNVAGGRGKDADITLTELLVLRHALRVHGG